MTASLTLTAAGAGAIADGANVGIAGVTFTRLALGAGTGAGDQSTRTALEDQRDIVAVTGAAATPERIAIRGDYAPSEAYSVTEVGLFARVGAGGAEFLCAYWIAAAAADAVAAAAQNTALVIAGIVEVQSSGADIAIAPAVTISIGAPANVVYQSQHATERQRGILEIATQPETDAGAGDARAVTPLKLAVRLATRVRVAGDTMTGDLLTVTPAADDDSRKAANTEWTMARIAEGAGVILAGSQDLTIGQTSDIALSGALTGYRWLRLICSRRSVGGGRAIVDPGVTPIAGLSAPDAGAALIGAVNGRIFSVSPATGAVSSPVDLGGDVAGLEALSRAAGLATLGGVSYFVGTNGTQVRAIEQTTGVDADASVGRALRLYRLDATDATIAPVGQWWAVTGIDPGDVQPLRGIALVFLSGILFGILVLGSGNITIVEIHTVVGRFVSRGRVHHLVSMSTVDNATAAFVSAGVVYMVQDLTGGNPEKLYAVTITDGAENNTVSEIGSGLGVQLRQGFGATVYGGTPYLLAAPGAEGPAVFDYPNVHLYTVDTTTGGITEVGDTGIPYDARAVGLTSASVHRDGVEVGGMLRVWRQADTVLRVRPVTGAGPVRIEQVIGYK